MKQQISITNQTLHKYAAAIKSGHINKRIQANLNFTHAIRQKFETKLQEEAKKAQEEEEKKILAEKKLKEPSKKFTAEIMFDDTESQQEE